MTRQDLSAIALAAALGAASLGGCAALDPRGDDDMPSGSGEIAAEIEQRLSVHPRLVGSQVTVQESDGTVVINGFADSLEEMRVIEEIVGGYDSASIENNVVVRAGS